MTGSEDLDPIRCKMLGGPFDGNTFMVDCLTDLPDEWWVDEERRNGDTVTIARRDDRKGGERYMLSAFEGGPEAFYAHHSLNRSVMVRRPQSWRESA